MKQDIYEYFESIYDAEGIEASIAEQNLVWDMYNNNPEQFASFVEENDIDLDVYMPYEYTFTAFEMWCDEMESR